MPIRPTQTSCTCCIIPLTLTVMALIGGAFALVRMLFHH